jgi:hypothetical protein
MYFHYLPQPQTYDGAQLRSQFILESTGFQGDAIVAFCGAADVGATHMVDQEDILASAWIKSNNMLHFIAEHFHMPLSEGVARQRLLVAIIRDVLMGSKSELCIERRGDDRFDGEKKLTVSIAAASPQSTCIHTAINIDSRNTPIPTRGLDDYKKLVRRRTSFIPGNQNKTGPKGAGFSWDKIAPVPFALDVLRRYSQECHDISLAICKVKPIR